VDGADAQAVKLFSSRHEREMPFQSYQHTDCVSHSRAGGIRTRGLLNPIQALYQAEPRPVPESGRIQRNSQKRNRNFAEEVQLYLNTRARLHSRMMEREQIPPLTGAWDMVVLSVRRDTGGAECGRELARCSFGGRGAAGTMEHGTALSRARAARDGQ
jgi:hypothetical protein